MRDYHLHSVIVRYDTLMILSADTDFYAYIGFEGQYMPFDRLIDKDCREKFLSVVRQKDTSVFVVNMTNNNDESFPVYMKIEYDGDNMSIELEAVEELRKGQEMFRNLHIVCQDLLSLHNDLGFMYDDKKQEVKLFTPDFRRRIKTYTIDEFANEIKSNAVPCEHEQVDSLIMSIKSDVSSYVYTFEGNIISISAPCKKSIVKGVMVDNLDFATSVGYIHRESSKVSASHIIEKDALTGTYSKREISNIIRKTIEVEHKENVALCIVDIDYFKKVNDNFGHMKGDEVLKDIARIIKTEVGNKGIVGRFGGDEFLILFYDVEDMDLYREKLRSIKNRVNTRYPGSVDNSTVKATLSIGCAVYPKDSDNYDDLFSLADFCLYKAKEKGRNRYIIYTEEKHGTLDEIKNYFNNNRRIDSRKDMSMGDMLCMIQDKHYNDESYTPEMLADDLVENLDIERVVCLSGEPLVCRCMSGINLLPAEKINEYSQFLMANSVDSEEKSDILFVDDIEMFKGIDERAYQAYYDMHIKSCILVRFLDAAGKNSLLSLEMTTTGVAWNTNQIYNYRTIARMFAKYEL